jgi:predicted transcriptional regulator
MKKQKYFIFKGNGKDRDAFILHDQEIVERYRRNAKKNNDTEKMAMTDEEIIQTFQRPGVVEINGDYIKQKRLDRGFTQLSAANACGVSINTYRFWERSGTTPNKENMMKLREVLKLIDVDKVDVDKDKK